MMNDFVVYHKPEKMGYGALDVERLGIYTSKPISGVAGARIWLLTGEDTPRAYRLRATFIISTVEPSDKAAFKTRISGKAGHFLDPMPVLNGEIWFTDFRREQGNFAFGFQSVRNPKHLAGLRSVLGASGVTL